MARKKQFQSIPPEFGGVQSTTPELQFGSDFQTRVPEATGVKGGVVAAPEEPKVRKAAGKAFIQRREKLRSQGLSLREATAQADLEQRGLGFRQVPVKETRERAEAFEQGLAEAGAFKEGPPKRGLQVEAEIEPGIVGGEVKQTIGAIRARELIDLIDASEIKKLGLEEFLEKVKAAEDITPEEKQFLLSLVSTETDLEVLKSGEATASQLGVLTEALTTESMAKWVPGVTTPKEAVNNIIKELSTIESDLRDDGRMADRGILDPSIALENADRYEQRILTLQSKLRFLVIQSPELQNSPEGVDALTQQTVGIITQIRKARIRAAQGAIEQEIVNPDEAILLFQQMKNRRKGR